jgi:glucose/arabinose dehydrogenase
VGAISLLGVFAASVLTAATGTKPAYRVHVVAKGLREPTWLAAAPGDRTRLYIVQRNGLVRTLARGRITRTPFLDLRSQTSGEGERGLLSIAFHPAYAQNGRVYAFFTGRDGDINIVEYQARGGRVDARSGRALVHVAHPDSPFHNGGQLAFGPDARLYAGIGDGGYVGLGGTTPPHPDPHGNSQNLDVLLGKIFSLDVEAAHPTPRIVAYGLRNPWRFSFVRASGDLIIGDVGYNTAEEIDVLPPSARQPVNFGWSVYEGREKRNEAEVALNQAGELLFPVLTYRTGAGHNCAVTGGYVYRGSVPRLRGRYVFGDYCSGRIWSVALRGGRATARRLEPFRVPSLSSFAEDARGELYAVSLLGRIYRVTRR